MPNPHLGPCPQRRSTARWLIVLLGASLYYYFIYRPVIELASSGMASKQLVSTLEKRVLSFWFEGYVAGQPVPGALMAKWFGGRADFDAKVR